MKSTLTLALAADRTVRERWVNNHGRSVLLDIAIRNHPNAGNALDRLAGDIYAADDSLPSQIAREVDAAHIEDADAPHCPRTWGEPNESEPDSRIVPTPGTKADEAAERLAGAVERAGKETR